MDTPMLREMIESGRPSIANASPPHIQGYLVFSTSEETNDAFKKTSHLMAKIRS